MHEYIQKIVDELERDYEPSEWVESILKEMQNIAIRETDAKWQAKVDELQKRVDAALKQTQFALQYVEEDMRGNHEFLQMAMIRTFKALEQALKGEGQ